VDEAAEKQENLFSEPGDYLLSVENINASVEEDPINAVPEFRFSIVAIMTTMIFAIIILVTKFRTGSK
jgi:hypothetical protein